MGGLITQISPGSHPSMHRNDTFPQISAPSCRAMRFGAQETLCGQSKAFCPAYDSAGLGADVYKFSSQWRPREEGPLSLEASRVAAWIGSPARVGLPVGVYGSCRWNRAFPQSRQWKYTIPHVIRTLTRDVSTGALELPIPRPQNGSRYDLPRV